MASKLFYVEPLGEVYVYKRRGVKRVNLKIIHQKIRVTQPAWLPYKVGLQFAVKNSGWIVQERAKQPSFVPTTGQLIGKDHSLKIIKSNALKSRVKDGTIFIHTPDESLLSEDKVAKITKNAIKRALKLESYKYLEPRLLLLSANYGFRYSSITYKSMKSRWGSCNSNSKITLNIYLLMLPWELIDYVLVHELVHTKHLHHGPAFWSAVSEIMPDYKKRKTELKSIQQSINILH